MIRRVAERAAGPGARRPELLGANARLQGDADGAAARRYFPDLQRRAVRERARARPLALLDEHVPELGARAPVPADRAQRRDQHAARQRQLDARARVAARLGAVRRRPRRRCCRSSGPAARTQRHSTTCSSCSCWPGRSLPHALMMMVPEAYRGRSDVSRRAARLLRVPRVPDRGVGRPGGDRVHRRPRDRRDARPQRPAARPLARDARRLGRARLRGGRARRPAGARRAQRAAAAREAVPRRPRARAASSPIDELKREVATRRPYGEWFEREHVRLADLPRRDRRAALVRAAAPPAARVRLHAGGHEGDARAARRERARRRSARWATTRRSRCSPNRRPLLYSYFKQLFAQVTNPPIDSIREAVVMSVQSLVGSERNLLDETPAHARQLVIENPILRDDELERSARSTPAIFKAQTIDITWPSPRRRGRARAGARAHLRRGGRGARRRREHPRPLRPRGRAGSRRRCRRCSRSARSTTTSCARARACRRGSSSSPASRAACRASPS